MLGGAASFAVFEFGEVWTRNTGGFRYFFLRFSAFFEGFPEGFREVVLNRSGSFHDSMIVEDLHVMSVAIFPSENDAPLAVDTDAVEAFSIAF